MKISVVIPVYGCPNALEPLYERLKLTLLKITSNYEIILVNDACPKGSWNIIKKICSKDKKVIGINLSRNFGQSNATNAGLDFCTGDYIVVMDCDLQEKPEGIEDLFTNISDGYDVVFSKRKNRIDKKTTLFLSKCFYNLYNYFSDSNYDFQIGNLSIASRKAVNEYKKIKDCNKVYISYLFWMGLKYKIIEIDAEERYDGKSSYTLSKKIDLAISEISSHSNKPLKVLLETGVAIASCGFIYLIVQIIKYFVNKDVAIGWTSIIGAIFLMGGLILFCLGGVGLYVGNIFNQVKEKPNYIIDNIINKKIIGK